MNWFLVDIQASHHRVVLPQSTRRFFGSESATQWDLYTPEVSTFDTESHVVESGLHLWTKGQHFLRQHIQQFFLKVFLFFRVRFGYDRPRFSESEAKTPE